MWLCDYFVWGLIDMSICRYVDMFMFRASCDCYSILLFSYFICSGALESTGRLLHTLCTKLTSIIIIIIIIIIITTLTSLHPFISFFFFNHTLYPTLKICLEREVSPCNRSCGECDNTARRYDQEHEGCRNRWNPCGIGIGLGLGIGIGLGIRRFTHTSMSRSMTITRTRDWIGLDKED